MLQTTQMPDSWLQDVRRYFEHRATASLEAAGYLRARQSGASERLVKETLRAAEASLRTLSGAGHIEISVWVDRQAPCILAYYDSAGNSRPRTDKHRRKAITYYRDKKYDVIQLLDSPTTVPLFKDRVSRDNYSFLSPSQKKQIRSTFLHCIDQTAPAAIVATADVAGGFTKKRVPLDLIYALGHAVRADLTFLQLERDIWTLRKPRLFIGSSVEGLSIARALQATLEHDADCTIWTDGVFGLSRINMESLEAQTRGVDFAVMVATPDDFVTRRHKRRAAMRDNVLFELGLFMGALGRDRTFLLQSSATNLSLPGDLAGISTANYTTRDDGNLEAALRTAATRIIAAVNKIESR